MVQRGLAIFVLRIRISGTSKQCFKCPQVVVPGCRNHLLVLLNFRRPEFRARQKDLHTVRGKNLFIWNFVKTIRQEPLSKSWNAKLQLSSQDLFQVLCSFSLIVLKNKKYLTCHGRVHKAHQSTLDMGPAGSGTRDLYLCEPRSQQIYHGLKIGPCQSRRLEQFHNKKHDFNWSISLGYAKWAFSAFNATNMVMQYSKSQMDGSFTSPEWSHHHEPWVASSYLTAIACRTIPVAWCFWSVSYPTCSVVTDLAFIKQSVGKWFYSNI